jgi:hypothetical protein
MAAVEQKNGGAGALVFTLVDHQVGVSHLDGNFGALAAGIMLAGILLTWLYLVTNVLNPLKALSRFLANRIASSMAALSFSALNSIWRSFSSLGATMKATVAQ